MGSESSKSESDSSNSGEKNSELEEMNDLKENKNTIINRVWVVKKSISLTVRNVDIFSEDNIISKGVSQFLDQIGASIIENKLEVYQLILR